MNESVLTVSVIIIVVAFAACTVGLLVTLRRIMAAVSSISTATETVVAELSRTASSTEELLARCSEVLGHADSKLQKLEPLLTAAETIGGVVHRVSGRFEQVATAVTDTALHASQEAGRSAGKYTKQVGEAIGIAEAGLTLYQYWQGKRRESSASSNRETGQANVEGSE